MRRLGIRHGADEGEDVVGDDVEHLRRRLVAEARPAHLLVGQAAALADLVLAFGKDPALDRLLQANRLVLLADLHVVEPADEEQIGDLLDHLERIGDAARPERIPDAVDLVPEFPRQQVTSP
jgi:hypothetical protein